jgi:hypothetical protein
MHEKDKMKLFGNEICGIAKRVLARLAVRQRYMGKKKWADGIDVVRLSGDEWLRLLTGETNITAFVGWCTNCRTGKCFEKTCLHCGAELLLFDDPFWCRAGHKIRLAIQKDRTLLDEVKSDRENLYGIKYVPTFPASLKWLLESWEQAPRPPHRSFDPKAHYLAANSIESLQRLGLSKEEIVDVLSNVDFPNGQVRWQGKDYAKIPGEDLRKLGEEFRRAMGEVPGSALDLSEMGRSMAWVNRQRTVPMARLEGERVRKKNAV